MRAKMAYVRKNIAELVINMVRGVVVLLLSLVRLFTVLICISSEDDAHTANGVCDPWCEKEKYQSYLNKTYGVFEYSHWRKQHTSRRMRSLCGCVMVEPEIKPVWVVDPPDHCQDAKGIDFGSGQGDYARMLRAKG